MWDLYQVYGVCAAIFVLSCLVCSPLCHSQTAATRPTRHGLSNLHDVFNIWWWQEGESANSQHTILQHTCGKISWKGVPMGTKKHLVLEASLLLLNPVNGSSSAICYASWYCKNCRLWAGNTVVTGKGAWGVKPMVMPLSSEKLCKKELGPFSCLWLD